MIIFTSNRPLIRRAMRAAISKKLVLLYAKQFWRVRSVAPADAGSVAIELIHILPTRKSIDDCTPAEWDAASRAVRKTY